MSESQQQAGHLMSGFRNWHDTAQRADADRPGGRPRRSRRGRAWRFGRWLLLTVFVVGAAGTAASLGYNLATDGPVPRPAGLLMANGGAFDTRYLEWGSSGTPVVLVPGAFETADTFA